MTEATIADRERYNECYRHGDKGWELAPDLVLNAIINSRKGERWRCASIAARAGEAKSAAEIVDDIAPEPGDHQYA